MRIIAGSARGRTILAPKGQNTRPTLDRVRESLFGILQFRLENARVLDLFAGSGALGLEALSRGAACAVFNDQDRGCCNIIRKNIAALNMGNRSKVFTLPAMQAIAGLTGEMPFDIAFLDPPYAHNGQAEVAALFQNRLMAPDGLVIVEHDYHDPPEAVPGLFRLVDQRRYRETGISFFSWEDTGIE